MISGPQQQNVSTMLTRMDFVHNLWQKIKQYSSKTVIWAILDRFGPNLGPKNRAFWAIGQKQELVHGSPMGVPKWDLSDIAIRIAIYHHWVDITQFKSLFHYGKSPFLAYLGLPLPEGGIKSWPQAWFHMATNHVEVTQAIGPTFGIIKSKKLHNNPLESILTIPFRVSEDEKIFNKDFFATPCKL